MNISKITATTMQFSDKLKAIRKLKKWSQQQFADKLEERRSTYAEWENGTIPSFDIVVKMSIVSGVPIAEFAATIDDNLAIHKEFDEIPTVKAKPSADFLAGKLESKEETIQQVEARRQDAVAMSLKMEAHYNDMKNALERAQETINEVLKPIKETVIAIKSNSEATLVDLQQIRNMTRADDLSIMEGTDKILGRELGTTATEASIVEHALGAPDEDIDMKDSNHKDDNASKEKQK
jgi:transcriptional regulator with XRE-family HTH domain